MLGRKIKTAKLFYALSLEHLVPADHLLRRVTAVVDFSFVRRRTAQYYSAYGQPGIDPEVLFKMALIGWLYNVTSERRLAEDCALPLAYRWFLGYDFDEPTPNHSVLSKARRRFGLWEYQAFFDEIVRQCQDAGLLQGDHLYVDSTLVKANASLESLASRVLLTEASDFVTRLFAENPGETGDLDAPSAALPTAPAPAPDAVPSGPRYPLHPVGPTDLPTTRTVPINTQLVSWTDPDASYLTRDNVKRGLYHKLHVGTDAGPARVITTVIVTSGVTGDEQLLGDLLVDHERRTGARVRRVTADKKYGTLPNYEALRTAGVEPNMTPMAAALHRTPSPLTAFVYDPATDRFTCPEGKLLRRAGTGENGVGTRTRRYRAKATDCAPCPLKASCSPGESGRSVTRPLETSVLHEVEQFLKRRGARLHRRQRKYWAETTNAELKEDHGLRTTRFRYRHRVQIHAYGASIGYNVMKLVRARWPLSRNTGVADFHTAARFPTTRFPTHC